MDKNDKFYLNLRKKLEENIKFPSDYLFKFIIPNEPSKKTDLTNVFINTGEIKYKESKNKNYLSISVLMKVNSAEKIIAKYKEASRVEGIISL